MKRLVLFAISAALLATAPAGARDLDGSSRGTALPKFEVGFTAVTRDGVPFKVKRFLFHNAPLLCDQGSLVLDNVGNPLPQMPVVNNRFKDTFSGGGQQIAVAGKFSNKGKRAEGTLRAQGDFVDSAGAPLTNCDSGKLDWVAK